MSGIRDRAHAHRDPRARADRRGRAFGGVELTVELREARAVGAAREPVVLRPGAAALEAGKALQSVLRPADGLAKLAVADHVDAGFGLAPDHRLDARAQAFGVSLLVVGLSGLLRTDKLQQLGRPDQAADVGRAHACGGMWSDRMWSDHLARNCSSEMESTG